MSKHTPGSWRIYGENYIEASSEDDHIGPIAEIRSDLAYPYSDSRVAATREANARLIAAAPELLNLAELVVDLDTPEDMAELRAMATKLIAKIRGEE